MTSMTKREAALKFAKLIKTYGVSWDSKVPTSAYQELQDCNMLLSERERRDITFKVQGVGSSG